ncbi:MAG: class A beta-lactamase-related serine hydrolase [Pedosphaera sp.]|nr:class A beta-lactamase-related serine hydrolase [Pedosphaera sp.]
MRSGRGGAAQTDRAKSLRGREDRRVYPGTSQGRRLAGIVRGGDARWQGRAGQGLWRVVRRDPHAGHLETRVAIASVTKQFTCACALLLAEDGKLSVNDKVANYFPDLTRAHDITLLDLMPHVSGYPDYYPLDFVDRDMAKTIATDDLIRRFARRPLDFEPGTKYSYSNTGYIILGRVVEMAGGESFGAFLEGRILQPLGMAHTTYEPISSSEEYARGYARPTLGAWEAAIPEGRRWTGAAGGICTTALDLLKWDLGLMEGPVLRPESFVVLTTQRKLTDGKLTAYGCGLGV